MRRWQPTSALPAVDVSLDDFEPEQRFKWLAFYVFTAYPLPARLGWIVLDRETRERFSDHIESLRSGDVPWQERYERLLAFVESEGMREEAEERLQVLATARRAWERRMFERGLRHAPLA